MVYNMYSYFIGYQGSDQIMSSALVAALAALAAGMKYGYMCVASPWLN
jgi:hypothetical protein